MKRRVLFLFLGIFFASWTFLNYYLISTHSHQNEYNLFRRLESLQSQIEKQAAENEDLLSKVRKYKEFLLKRSLGNDEKHKGQDQKPKGQGQISVPKSPSDTMVQVDPPVFKPEEINTEEAILPVLVFACNRVTVKQNLDQLIKHRPSVKRFPIVVSQDCGHGETAKAIQSYGSQVTHIQHPDLSDIPLPWKEKKFLGYFKIARHYKWALNQVFHKLNYTTVIIVEDDLDISPDFFEYFGATFPILHYDPTLWCVSAWNDNGKAGLVSDEADLLYRTDFFPGLGWMMEKRIWKELEPKWPKTFWDDWMRHPDQRKNRSCIRPEISRTRTFGRIGVSKGQYYDKHLRFIRLNTKYVPFTKMNLSYLNKENYDQMFVQKVYNSPLLTIDQVLQKRFPDKAASVRLEYSTKEALKSMAKKLGLMDDLKSGVPRMGYRGVVTFLHGGKRIYLAPPPTWDGYNTSWS